VLSQEKVKEWNKKKISKGERKKNGTKRGYKLTDCFFCAHYNDKLLFLGHDIPVYLIFLARYRRKRPGG
jgi:hypothetical protein